MTEPVISVFMPVYNHAPFIEQAIESVMSQNTEYPIELVVCDDFSTDGSRDVIDRLAVKYSNIVKSYQPHNTKGVRNMMQGLSLLRGRYVAMCEGDDYWTDSRKLQKQVSFLEANPEFTVSTHKVAITYTDAFSNSALPQYVYKDCTADEQRVKDGIFYADEVVDNYYMHTSSMVFRWKFRDGIPHFFRMRMLLDHFLLLMHAADGKIKYFDEPMSAWRRHANSYSYAQLHDKGLFFQKEGEDWLLCYKEIDRYFHGRFKYQIRERMLLAIRALTEHCMSTGQYEQLRSLYQKYWYVIEKPVLGNQSIAEAFYRLFPEKRDFCPPWSTTSAKGKAAMTIPMNPGLDLDRLSDAKENLWTAWTKGREWSSFGNPASAIAAYCHYYGINTVWLPVVCPIQLDKVLHELQIVRKYYPVNMQGDAESGLVDLVNDGELVIWIDIWGNDSSALCHAFSARKKVHRINILRSPHHSDNAKAIYDFSLFGAPDGALLVGEGVEGIMAAGIQNSICLPLSAGNFLERRELELAWQLPAGPAGKLSCDIIKKTPIAEVESKRRWNWQYLKKYLGKLSWLDELSADSAPPALAMGIPPGTLITAFVGQLVENGIDARRTWPLVSADCIAKSITDRLVLIPCGHHLGKLQLDYIIDMIGNILENRHNALNISQRSAQ